MFLFNKELNGNSVLQDASFNILSKEQILRPISPISYQAS